MPLETLKPNGKNPSADMLSEACRAADEALAVEDRQKGKSTFEEGDPVAALERASEAVKSTVGGLPVSLSETIRDKIRPRLQQELAALDKTIQHNLLQRRQIIKTLASLDLADMELQADF